MKRSLCHLVEAALPKESAGFKVSGRGDVDSLSVLVEVTLLPV